MLHDYRVIAVGHTHAGKALPIGTVVALRPGVAARFPAVFERTEPHKATRPARPPVAATPTED